jgi:DNA-binding MarR family transcriptional regulator
VTARAMVTVGDVTLSAAQLRVLCSIYKHRRRQRSASLADIREDVGLASDGSVNFAVGRLVELGLVKRTPGAHRSLRLTERGKRVGYWAPEDTLTAVRTRIDRSGVAPANLADRSCA